MIWLALLGLHAAQLSPPTPSVVFVGKFRQIEGELRQTLGPATDLVFIPNVEYMHPEFFNDGSHRKNWPDVAVVQIGLEGLSTVKESPKLDSRAWFEKLLSLFLTQIKRLEHRDVRVILLRPDPPTDKSPETQFNYESILIPLETQAAREAGVEFVDLSDDKGNPKAEADDLADLIAPHAAKANWHIVRVSSQQADEGPATNAIDGDPNTYWHSQYDPVVAKPPHELVIDLGQPIWLAGFRYTPRQDGGDNGIARDYELYVGDDPDKQDILAAKGAFKRGADRKSVRFAKPVQGRYLRFVILSAQNREPFGSAAELDIIRDHSHE